MAINTQQLKEALDRAKAEPNSSFALELQKRIESGRFDSNLGELGLQRTAEGIRPARPNTPFGSETIQDITSIGSGIRDRAIERADKSGESTNAFQKFGQGAGFASDIVGEVVKGGVKAVLPQNAENKVSELIANFGESVAQRPETQKLVSWYTNLPEETQKNLDAVGGITSLATEIFGGSIAKAPLKKAGTEVIEQVSKQSTKLADDFVSGIKSIKAPKNVVSDVIKDISDSTNPSEIASRSFTKAFKFAPEDVTVIEGMIDGKNVANWANSNNLIKDTAKETLDSFADFKKQNYESVRDAVSLVDDKYSMKDVPSLESVVDGLIKDTDALKSPKFSALNKRLKDIAEKFNRGEGDLLDVQTVKGAFDDLTSVYKRSGDVKTGVRFADMAESASDLRRFIEDRTTEAFPDINVRELNRNVQVASEFINSALKRSGKIDTQSITSLGDYAVFGLGQQALPGLGIATFGAKKILESAPMRLRIARNFAGTADFQPTDIESIKKSLTKALNESVIGR